MDLEIIFLLTRIQLDKISQPLSLPAKLTTRYSPFNARELGHQNGLTTAIIIITIKGIVGASFHQR